jgi:hypothetical protein
MAVEKENSSSGYPQLCISPEFELFNGKRCYKIPSYSNDTITELYIYWSITSNRWEASSTNFGVSPVAFLTNSTASEPISSPPTIVWQNI